MLSTRSKRLVRRHSVGSCWIRLTGAAAAAVTFRAYPEADAFAGLCDELAVASAGDTPAEAIEMVIEATLLYLDTLEELEERRRVFTERGLLLEPGLTGSKQAGGPVEVYAGETVTRM